MRGGSLATTRTNQGVFWACVAHGFLSGTGLILLGVTGVEQFANGSPLEDLLTHRVVEAVVGTALVLSSFLLVVPKRKIFWVTAGVNLLSFCVYLAHAYEAGSNFLFGMGILVDLPFVVIWYLIQLSLLNALRIGLWPKGADR